MGVMALFVVLLLSLVESYQREMGNIRTTMRYALETESSDLLVPNIGSSGESMKDDSKDGIQPYGGSILVYIVEVNESGHILSRSDTAYMDEDILVTSVAIVLSSGEFSGEIGDYGLFYSMKPISDGVRIAFTDSSHFYDTLTERLLMFLVIFSVASASMLVIGYVVAGIAVRPVIKSWTSQQRFIADASHELKTPLTVILANSDIVKSHPDAQVSEQMRWIDGIHDEGVKMQGLVQDLLLLAQTEPGMDEDSASGNEERIDLSSIVELDLLQFEAIAYEREASFEESIEPDLYVKGDPSRTDRVVRILLDNALKYAHEDDDGKEGLTESQGSVHSGGPDVVKVKLISERGKAVLSVNNGGKPIPAEDISHVFDRFYRGDKSRTDSGERSGFGLGLAIAHNIVTGMGGTISVSSDAVNGTTFTVRLPLA